jgi:hypothetical protein
VGVCVRGCMEIRAVTKFTNATAFFFWVILATTDASSRFCVRCLPMHVTYFRSHVLRIYLLDGVHIDATPATSTPVMCETYLNMVLE